MLQNLIRIIAGGAITLGMGGGALEATLTQVEHEELIEARTSAVEVLTAEDKELISSLEGNTMRDLTFEQKEELREIKEKLREATNNNIEDEALKQKLEEHHEQRVENRMNKENGQRKGNGQGPRNNIEQ